ncbi:MAG: MotA/TolQ/ExbB proton channel family protein [Campylobacterales bacterium]|nr:MotA/TolQ/ExbB proton channel family protein [Campylobacterales bacterium]
MKKILLLAFFITTLVASQNDTQLMLAYQKEFAFLKAQKESLKTQLSKLESRHSKTINKAKDDVEKLQNTLLGYNIKIEEAQKNLHQMQLKKDVMDDDTAMVETVKMQMKSSLKTNGSSLDEDKDPIVTLKNGFNQSINRLGELESVVTTDGFFHLKDGKRVDGKIIHIGNVAAYGISDEFSGALAPAGNNVLKVWPELESTATAMALKSNQTPQKLNIFIYESLEKEIEYAKEKTLEDFLASGGLVGYSIVGLGLFAVLLIIIRIVLLSSANSKTENIIRGIEADVELGNIDEALSVASSYKGSTARVMQAVLKNIRKNREHIEDIVMENILNESTRLDRYNAFILVIAAVAPLLGLLGTVTGMISTFDIITEHGTGDPKLLAGGISEALVTTELGLIVAIPALLAGNILMGWSRNIKDSMEENALRIVNIYNKNR